MKPEFTSVHELAYIYLGFAKLTDSVLTKEEFKVIANCINRYVPEETSLIRKTEIIEETLAVFNEDDKETKYRRIYEFAHNLKKKSKWNEKVVGMCMEDMNKIANANYEFLDCEKRWIESLAKLWEIEGSS